MKRVVLRRLSYILTGAAAGFAYYAVVGCVTGACPISSNPYMSTAYGALVGFVLGFRKRTSPGPAGPTP